MNLKNKKVLVIGSDGFIGSHLVERLLKEDCQVKAFVYYNSFNSWGWIDIGNHEDYVTVQEGFESRKDKFLPGDGGSY